jgi:hypothetical protein
MTKKIGIKMITKFEKYINEGIFDIFKDKKFHFEPIQNSLWVFSRQYMQEHEDPDVLQQVETDINELNQIQDPPPTYKQLERKTELLIRLNKVLEPMTLRANIAYAREKLVGKEIEVKNKKITVNDCGRNNNYIIFNEKSGDIICVNNFDFIRIKVKKEINRKISTTDPYGEEDWGD